MVMKQPRQTRGAENERPRQITAKGSGGDLNVLVDRQHTRQQVIPGKSVAVTALRNLVVRSTVYVVEYRSWKGRGGGFPYIGHVMRVLQHHSRSDPHTSQ